MIVIDKELKYKIIKDEDRVFNEEDFKKLYTDFFKIYDYIVADIAFNKLRLKGFCAKTNKKINKYNDYRNLDKYLKNECAYGSKYYIVEKIK